MHVTLTRTTKIPDMVVTVGLVINKKISLKLYKYI